ncbi:MAG: SDR family oxidoreductase [Actinomycetota bacterium]|nr:SDR family oxidoreductase [Actinomycetota bacterium]
MSENLEVPTALITGASTGLGRALARALAEQDWHPIITARGRVKLNQVRDEFAAGQVTAVHGDVSAPAHRAALAEVIRQRGRLDLVVNNASRLGPSPMPRLAEFPLDELIEIYATNVVAPLGVLQVALPLLRAAGGVAVNISSDAAVAPYEGWGGYGSSKAALDHLTAIFAAENPDVPIYSFDPGDMRTEMHQAAFPGEDISDRPKPETAVPALLRLIDLRPPSGRYIGSELLAAQMSS